MLSPFLLDGPCSRSHGVCSGNNPNAILRDRFRPKLPEIQVKVRVVLDAAGSGALEGYDVQIDPGLIDSLATLLLRACPRHRYAVIADSNVAKLYGERVVTAVRTTGRAAELYAFPAGEENKTRQTWLEVSDRMLASGLGRDAAVLALGGGVTGDLAGFVAATYLRGIPVVQLPTTILAMIDSSVGGKTGVDTPAGKNLIGAFHQPALVVADIETLVTLPPEQVRSGLAEAVKHGAIADAEYFDWIRAETPRLLALHADTMIRLIGRSVEIKAAVVAEDEREGGLRKTLNFGHTIGHSVEALSGFNLLHGEAIAIGMVVEATLGELLRVTEAGTAGRLETSLAAIGLPTAVPAEFTARAILDGTRVDKKARGGVVEYSLIERIGVSSRGSGSYGIPVEDTVVVEAIGRCRSR
jgi:3-dehydroquinate synthase